MQRDWDLIREILAVLEARDTTHGGLGPDAFPDHPKEVVSYHFHLLHQAGLIDATIKKTANTGIFGIARSLTWEGQEFLDKIRNDTLWNKIKSTVKDKGLDLTFDTIKAAAAALIKAMF
jgi:hypothetical protein